MNGLKLFQFLTNQYEILSNHPWLTLTRPTFNYIEVVQSFRLIQQNCRYWCGMIYAINIINIFTFSCSSRQLINCLGAKSMQWWPRYFKVQILPSRLGENFTIFIRNDKGMWLWFQAWYIWCQVIGFNRQIPRRVNHAHWLIGWVATFN